MQNTIIYRQTRRQVERKLRFFIHLTVYLLVNGWLIFLHQSNQAAQPWSIGPLFGWGIGLLFHGLSVFLRAPGTIWKHRMIKQ